MHTCIRDMRMCGDSLFLQQFILVTVCLIECSVFLSIDNTGGFKEISNWTFMQILHAVIACSECIF